MAEMMTLETAARLVAAVVPYGTPTWKAWEVIRAHLTQPAQAVDVGAGSAHRGECPVKMARAKCEAIVKHQFQDEHRHGRLTLDVETFLREFNVARDSGATRALGNAQAEGFSVPEGWREAFEDCYMRANEVGILHRDDDGEYTSAFTKVAWALWNERACLSPIAWWHASRDDEAQTWTVHSPSGDSCEVHERAAGPHAEILRQIAQSLPTPPQPEE
jgi:hypothetical protein